LRAKQAPLAAPEETYMTPITSRAALAIALLLPLLLSGCDRRTVEDDRQSTAEPGTPAATSPAEADRAASAPVATVTPEPADTATAAPAANALTQADALAWLVAADEHEIAAADQALARNVTGKVRDYAQMMKTDHGKNLTDTTRLGAATSTAAAVTVLKQKGEADLRALDANAGAAYEKAYVDAMVRGHTDVLAMFDSTLLPAATDANVRQHFTTTRATVARHLDKAKELQAAMK
jgi:putative membrane protein